MPAFVNKNTGIDTDWQDAMLRGGVSQNYMFSIRGGSENAQYSLSYNHADEKGIFLGNNYRQDNARLKLHMNKYIFDIVADDLPDLFPVHFFGVDHQQHNHRDKKQPGEEFLC